MSKEHVKLYKSKKTWVAATVAAAVLGISGVSTVNNVNADVLPASIVKNEPATTANGQHPNDKVAANMQYNRGIDPLTDNALKNETPAQQQKAKEYIESLDNGQSSINEKTKQGQKTSTSVKKNANSVVANKQVKTTVVNTAGAAQSKNANASSVKNTLPTTGEAQSKNTVALGVEAISLGAILGGLSFLKRKHN